MTKNILLCITEDIESKVVIDFAGRLAKMQNANLTAIYVETPKIKMNTEETRKILNENKQLAESYGAKIINVYGTNIEDQIINYASVSKIHTIVIGRSKCNILKRLFNSTFMDKIARNLPEVEVCIVPTERNEKAGFKYIFEDIKKIEAKDIFKMSIILLAITILGKILLDLGFASFNIIPLYILGILVIAMNTRTIFYSITGSIVSVLLFNFFLTVPYYTFKANGADYPLTFFIMVIVGIMISILAAKVKKQALDASEKAYRTKIFMETSQSLEEAESFDEIIRQTAVHIEKMLGRWVFFYVPNKENQLKVYNFNEDNKEKLKRYVNEDEKAVAHWVHINNKMAGAGTNTFRGAKCLYLAIRGKNMSYAVISIAMEDDELSIFEMNLLVILLSECSLAIDKFVLKEQKRIAEIKAEKEQLQNMLLRTISHDIRTPLTSISGNASILLQNNTLDEDDKKEIYTDIYEDSMWLYSLVENLLSSTRINSDNLEVRKTTELLSDILDEALNHINMKKGKYNIAVIEENELMFVEVDIRLIIQVFVNLIENAIKYSKDEAKIKIKLIKSGNNALVEVYDKGNGVSQKDKEHIFEMFYSGNNDIGDARRGMGLGLALCKSIVELHGGNIGMRDNDPKGSVFYFTLPLKEVILNE